MGVWLESSGLGVRGSSCKRVGKKASVMITAHQASTMEAVVAVVDSSREAGIYAISLTTASDNNN